jgi:hypothetical protein
MTDGEADSFEFREASAEEAVPSPVPDNADAYRAGGPGDPGPARPNAPNSVFLKLGTESFVSWQSDASIAVLALIMLIIIVIALLVVIGISLFPNAPMWLEKVSSILVRLR